MMSRSAFLAGLLLAGILAGAAWPPAPTTDRPAARERFRVDPVHSTVLFRVKHLGVSYFYGRFNDVSGAFVFDPESPDRSSVEIEIQAASIDTASPGRDRHLEGPEFFDVEKHPLIAFKSKTV